MARNWLQELKSGQTSQGSAPKIVVKRPEVSNRHPVGAVAMAKEQNQKNRVLDLDTTLVDDWGPIDRFDEVNTVDDDLLRENIEKFGQLSPILVRPGARGRYEIIYGRRRLTACRRLGNPVRALVKKMTDEEAVVAKGSENSARKDLSYHERFRYAAAIIADGFDRTTVMAALNTAASNVSVMLKVANSVPTKIGALIGPAPGTGRNRWKQLADACTMVSNSETLAQQVLGAVTGEMESDERFLLLLAELSTHMPQVKPGVPTPKGTTSKSGPRRITRRLKSGPILSRSVKDLTIKLVTKDGEGFIDWVDENAESIMDDLRTRFEQVSE